MKTWKIKATISVADSWVADGFDLKDRIKDIEEFIHTMLPHAYEHEVKATIQVVATPVQDDLYALVNGDIQPKD